MSRILAMVALGAAMACAPPESKPPPPRPEVVLYDVTLRSYRGGALVASARATRLAYERSSSDVELDSPQLQLPPRAQGEGRLSALGAVQIRSAKADGNVGARRLEAYGGVELRAQSGMVAKTDRALFEGEAKMTSGAGPVQVRAPNYSLDAVGFVLSSRDEDFNFGGPLKSGLGTPTE